MECEPQVDSCAHYDGSPKFSNPLQCAWLVMNGLLIATDQDTLYKVHTRYFRAIKYDYGQNVEV